jgi:hypothetical protein
MTNAMLALLLALALGALAIGCGDGSTIGGNPVDEQCTVVGGEVLYDSVTRQLTSTVTVTVANADGIGLTGHLVTLDASRSTDTVVEVEGIATDETGEAMFHVHTDSFGQGVFAATLVGSSLELSQRATVDFTLGASATYGDVTLTSEGGEVAVDIVLTDAAGAVVDADIILVSDRADDVIEPSSATTGASGDASFLLTAAVGGEVRLSLEVSGLQGSLPLDPSTIAGPSISGEVTFAQPGGVLYSPRVGLFYLDYTGWESGLVGDPEELASVDLTVANGDTVPYELLLPFNVPTAHLLHPDEPGLPPDFQLASYIVVVYDDVGTVPGAMDAGDLLAGMDSDLPTVSWFSGTLPPGMPSARLGYNMMEMPSGQGAPTIYPWDDWADQMDLEVTMAEVTGGDFNGTIDFGSGLPSGSELTLAILLVDPDALFAGNPWDPANKSAIASLAASYSAGGTLPYSLPLPDLTQDPHFDSWTMNMGGGAVLNWAIPILYYDMNQDGQWDPGAEPAYGVDRPFGIEQIFIWYIHRGGDWMHNLHIEGIHPGYSIVRMPLEFDVQQIFPATGRLQLDDNIEPGHSNISFVVTREVAGDDVEVISGSDLGTGTVESNEVWTLADVTLVQPGDTLTITEVIDKVEFLPVSTPADFTTD